MWPSVAIDSGDWDVDILECPILPTTIIFIHVDILCQNNKACYLGKITEDLNEA